MRNPGHWTHDRLVQAFRSWAACNGRSPRQTDWKRADETHPCHQTVYNFFGSWEAGLKAAGLDSSLEPGRTSRFGQWGPEHHAWKGDAVKNAAGRTRAVRRYELGPCEECGKPACDRHHIDGNTANNAPDNIAILCRRCHMTVDGRLEHLLEVRFVPPVQPPVPCIECGRVAKPRRRGLCHACNERRRRREKKAMAAA